MKPKLWPLTLILGLTFLLNVESPLQAKNLCVPIPARAANKSRDPFNGTIPAANIQVRVEGKKNKNKPTIVFIHGFEENISEWNCIQKALKDQYRTIAFDLRGYGRSTKTPAPLPPVVPTPSGEINYTIQVFADDLKAILTKLDVSDNIILVGHSLGCGVALNYATTYSGIKKLVLVSGSPLFFVDCKKALAPCITTVSPKSFPNCSSCKSTCCKLYPTNEGNQRNKLCCVFPGSLQFVELLTLEITKCLGSCPTDRKQCPLDCVLNLYVKPYVLNEGCTNPSFLKLQQNVARTVLLQTINPAIVNILDNTVLVAASQDQRSLLSKIRVPTLLCAGTIDQSVDPRNSLYMHQRIKKSVLAHFLGKGHELNLTDVKNFNNLISGFISGKKYPRTLKIGKAKSCDVCPSAYTSTNFTECTP